jgi:hypothetical protein
LTAAQKALAEFLEVDPDLLAGAGMGSLVSQDDDISQKEMENWIEALHRDEVTAALKHILEGKGQHAERSLKNRFAAWRRGLQTGKTEAPRRMVGELRQNAEKACKSRLKKFMAGHLRRKALIQRPVKAGIWKEK